MDNLEVRANRFTDEVFNSVLKKRSSKYGFYFKLLRSTKFVPFYYTRGKLLESFYVLFRYIDDVVDGDLELPEHYSSIIDFLDARLKFMENRGNPSEDINALMEYCFRNAEKLRLNIEQETCDILGTLRFDAERRGTFRIYNYETLYHYFYLLDIRGTVRGALKLFGEDVTKEQSIIPLAMASRIYYNLSDFRQDINSGLVNIPSEDMASYGIRNDDLFKDNSDNVRRWFIDEAKKGLNFLEEHNRNMQNTKLKFLAKRLAFPLIYEIPAREYFDRTLLRT